MHPRSSQRPSWALALRLLGSLLILAGLLIPQGSAEAAGAPTHRAAVADRSGDGGGACGETEQEELVDCGASLERALGEPFAIALLRELEVRMSEQSCTELLFDIWSQQICEGQGRECGKMNSGTPPGPSPRLASSSSSARSSWASHDLGPEPVRDLDRGVGPRGPSSRDIEPPVPPPKL